MLLCISLVTQETSVTKENLEPAAQSRSIPSMQCAATGIESALGQEVSATDAQAYMQT